MTERQIRKGDRVWFRHVMRPVQGEVKEDRGPIGIGGRRLYGIEFRFGPQSEDVMYTELPAERLYPTQAAVQMG